MLTIREAEAADLEAIVAMLADDPLGRTREDPSLPLAKAYLDAFAAIQASPDQHLVVAVEDGAVVGTLQLVFLPGISRRGAWRGQIEAVRIAADRRGRGLGEKMVGWAVERCRERGCRTVQLTSDASRADAHRFWERVGFKATHRGFKMDLG